MFKSICLLIVIAACFAPCSVGQDQSTNHSGATSEAIERSALFGFLMRDVRDGSITSPYILFTSKAFEQLYGAKLDDGQVAALAHLCERLEAELPEDANRSSSSLISTLELVYDLIGRGRMLPSLLASDELELREKSFQVRVPYAEQVEQTYTVDQPMQQTRTQQYTIMVPVTELVTQTYTVSVPQPDGTSKTEQRTREVKVTKMLPETREREVTYTVMAPETRTRTVTVTAFRNETRNMTVKVPKENTQKLTAFVNAARNNLSRVVFKSTPAGAEVNYVKEPSTDIKPLDLTTTATKFFTAGKYRFLLYKSGLGLKYVDKQLIGKDETVEVVFSVD